MVQRGFHALEAATFFADKSCGFRPLIGDLCLPVFQALTVIPTDLSRVIYHHKVVMKESYVNQSEVPVKHRFHLSWNTSSYDKIAWCRPWGLCLASSFSFTVEEAQPTLQYTEDNDLALVVFRQVSEEATEEVEVPPNTEATVRLWAKKHINASISFIAQIQKVKPDGSEVIMNEPGAWNGLVYRNLQLQITMRELCSPHESCAVM
ncbi:hypothetical protein JRQ81_003715 [Phrynocephalus forsythii]|uniref:Uncharacterized protein n=1 Tax=Phrynocephalus forsythii TaxID=171643 RepID=A0A9Q0XKC7_9SAUR|nr:hypothetical protein JRQ81_003715 [Phrynocephalus forsythii]